MFHALEITFELIVCELFRGCYDFVSLFSILFFEKLLSYSISES